MLAARTFPSRILVIMERRRRWYAKDVVVVVGKGRNNDNRKVLTRRKDWSESWRWHSGMGLEFIGL